MENTGWLPQHCQADPCPFALRIKRDGVHEGKCPDCGTVAPRNGGVLRPNPDARPETRPTRSGPAVIGRDRTPKD